MVIVSGHVNHTLRATSIARRPGGNCPNSLGVFPVQIEIVRSLDAALCVWVNADLVLLQVNQTDMSEGNVKQNSWVKYSTSGVL